MSLDTAMLERVTDAAVTEAIKFFDISDEVQVYSKVLADEPDAEGGAASIDMHHDYLRARITFYSATIESYEKAWGYAGHEVAHLVTRELDTTLQACSVALRHVGNTALEQATTRLQRLFERERPYPGDAQFEAP